MNILKYKYKAHKLINYAFYLVVFLIGFGIGIGAKKIDFNKLISQFLMIDSVSATTIYDNGSPYVDEEYVYNYFNNNFDDFDFNKYNNIICTTTPNGNVKVRCYAFDNSFLENSYIYSYAGSFMNLRTIEELSYYRFYIDYYNNTTTYSKNILSIDSNFNMGTRITDVTSGYITYSNIDFNTLKTNTKNFGYSIDYIGRTESNLNSTISNVIPLDFSSYLIPDMVYNENLFKDNPDFKQVCVENNKVFAITRATNSEVNEYFDYDYIWFPFGLDGLAKGLYDSSLDDKFSYYTEQDTFGYYWFKNKENIDNYFNNDIPGLELEMKGYTNKYSYYGWSAHYFRMYFEGENTQFTIFKFVNPTTLTYNDETNTNHGGGGLRLDGDEEIQISNNYCFYVKNEYEVQYINVDEWEDYYGTVITPNGDYDFNTSHNKNNSNTDNFLSQPISFINSMKDTISFINSLIYELYISLPVLLRTFIITLLIILIIMLIMRIGGYK